MDTSKKMLVLLAIVVDLAALQAFLFLWALVDRLDASVRSPST